MTDSEQTLDYLEQQIPSLSAAAVDVAYWQALGTGQEVLVSGEGGLYQAFPDGTRKLVKPLEKPLSAVPLPSGASLFRPDNLTSQSSPESATFALRHRRPVVNFAFTEIV